MASETQNVGFVGFITRKDKDTGVNLLAKIVTPNKKRSLNKLVRVKIKANALDDYSCCVIDHAAMKKVIESSQDLEAVNESFQFLYNGEHGTSISYQIEKSDEGSDINEYLSEDGTLSGRPKYSPTGAADAVGYIRITVTKNDAEVSSRIMIRIKGMNAEEVLNSDKIYNKTKSSLSEFLWDTIAAGTGNGLYNAKPAGYTQICDRLQFTRTNQIFVPEISEAPITCAWKIEYDEIGNFMKSDPSKFDGIYTLAPSNAGSRICMDKDSPDYGCVYKPSYKATCDYLEPSGFSELIKTNDNEASDRRFRIGNPNADAGSGKLKLVATLTLGEAQPVEVVYMCATTSMTMTTDEVADFVESIAQIGLNGNWYKYDNNALPIVIPKIRESDVGVLPQEISIYGKGKYSALSSEQYRVLSLAPTTLSNVVRFKTEPSIYKVENNGSGFTVTNEIYGPLGIFETSSFEQVDETIGTDVIHDVTRKIVIPKGNPTENTGLYKADDVLNNHLEFTSFAVKFKLEIISLGSGQSPVFIDCSKIFTLTR